MGCDRNPARVLGPAKLKLQLQSINPTPMAPNKTIINIPRFLIAFALICALNAVAQTPQNIDLSGAWSFQLDGGRVGERERWFEKSLTEEIRLPGTTDESGFGDEATESSLDKLTRRNSYYGPAWYRKTIHIPESWKGRRVELFLERVMWESKVWIDDHYIGMAESLSAPHRFDLSDYISPGSHTITLRIDNRYKYNIGMAEPSKASTIDLIGQKGGRMWTMAVTDESQTTWNGVIGRMEITSSDPVWVERFETYPDLKKQQTRVVAILRNLPGTVTSGQVTVSARGDSHRMGPVTAKFRTKGPNEPVMPGKYAVSLAKVSGPYLATSAETRVEIILPFGEGAKHWDEFSPSLYELTVTISAESNGRTFSDQKSGSFGLREFVADGRDFRLNGRKVFLRGHQDNCIHPLTGYPPMGRDYWVKFLKKYQDYGLNHVRFHSWCPPEAAFDAADQLGMIVQVESPMWDDYGEVGKLPDRAGFIRYEMERILDAYGNHPSFCMFSVGNELGPGTEFYLQYLVEVLRDRDNRHLYTCASAPASNQRNDDFAVGANGVTGDWACSLTDTCFRGLPRWNGQNNLDFRNDILDFKCPVISHEIGQHTSYPNYYTWFIPDKYTGHLEARYINTFRRQFEMYHSAERGHAFAKASGALQLLLYKAELEVNLRTPNLSGYHLNGLSDYPGEGVALIGVLDAMMESKGIVTPEEFRQFNSETVPLVRLPRQNMRSGESIEAIAEVRHHGPHDLLASDWRWSITDQSGKELKGGSFIGVHVPTGGLAALGTVRANIPELKKAEELTLTLSLEGGAAKNSWRFWVYPELGSVNPSQGVLLSTEWNQEVRDALQSGRSVLLTPSRESVRHAAKAKFWTEFWSHGESVGSMGIYCDPKHPALAQFPTRSHSDWQWYDLLTGSYVININSLPFEFEPVVQMIDFFKTSYRLSLVMEARVGKGRLLVSTLNLGNKADRTLPQKQMLYSLLQYAGSQEFNPLHTLTVEQFDSIFISK